MRIESNKLSLGDTTVQEIERAFKVIDCLQMGNYEMVEPFQDLQIITNAKLLPPNEVHHNQNLLLRFLHRREKSLKNTRSRNSKVFVSSKNLAF